MPEIVRLSPADSRRIPWRNGRGVTEEIALGPRGAAFERDDYAWRVSKACVAEDGPFSAFPGIDRVIVVTDGAGLALSHGDAAPPARVAPLVPYRFSGDWPTTASLAGGPVTDFNVLTRRGTATADVRVLDAGPRRTTELDSADEVLVHVLAAAAVVRIGASVAFDVPLGGTLWARVAGEPVEVCAEAPNSASVVIVVAIRIDGLT